MQFQIATRHDRVDLARVECALREVDPAAFVDLAGNDGLRVSTVMSVRELNDAIARAGYPVSREQIVALKSECCGGCGG
jgi:hypothetical protein